MELFEPRPAVDVDTAEYIRLLGFPRGHVLEGRALELAEWAREWYASHGRPWIYARETDAIAVDTDSVRVEDETFTSPRLQQTLRDAGAHGVVLVAVGAGPELERQAHRAWVEERPDEYFFLEMFGSAVVEHLTALAGARLCDRAESEDTAVLPHYSPGYPEWDIRDQKKLLTLIGRDQLPGELDVLESGMLRPKKSLLAVFGLTRHIDRVRHLPQLVPCENCSFRGCQFRRAPYTRAVAPGDRGPAPAAAAYGISQRALRRWARERLRLTTLDDGTTEAVFRYEGTTCSNMGRSLAFDYRVTLGPHASGYPIQAQSCRPAPGDDGHLSMCEYIRDGDRLLETMADECPLAGRPLDDVLCWKRPLLGPGCYCESTSREHKWGLVLETIHYALRHSEGIQEQ